MRRAAPTGVGPTTDPSMTRQTGMYEQNPRIAPLLFSRGYSPLAVQIPEGAMARGKRNDVQRLREEQLMSKAELARRAGVSVLTIDRVERGAECRVDTKRKIILALGYTVEDRRKVFPAGNAEGAR